MSIADKITSIETHMGDIYNTLELGGADLTNVNKNINNVSPILKSKYMDYMNNGTDEIWNNWEHQTGTGTEATLNNTIYAPMKIDPIGRSVQFTTQGKQLVGLTDTSGTASDVTYSVQDGVVTLNGSANAQGTIEDTTLFNIVADGNYTISIKPISGTWTGGSIGISGWTGSTQKWFIQHSYASTYSTKSLTSVDGTSFCRLYFTSAGAFNNFKFRVMLNTGSTAEDYEPYTAGASPNPSYPQEIRSAGDNINLLDEATIIKAKYINSSGAEKTDANWVISNYIEVEKLKKYTYQGLSSVGSSPYTCYYDSSKNFVSSFKQASGINTIEIPDGISYIRFSIRWTELENFKIEKGDKASEYSPSLMGRITIKKSNKNLFNGLDSSRKVSSGISSASTVISENYIEMSGSSSWGSLTLTYKLSKNKDYILSFKEIDDISHKAGVSIYGTNVLMHANTDLTNLLSNLVELTANTEEYITASFNSGAYDYIVIRFWNNSTATALETATNLRISEIQLEYNTSATTYIAHQGKTYILPTQQPMVNIDNIADDFVQIANQWYERHKIGQVKLSSKYNWYVTGTSHYQMTYPSQDRINLKQSGKGLCNYFSVKTSGTDTYLYPILQSNVDYIRISNATSIWESIDDFKTFIDEHDVEFIYPLAEPTLLPCTEEQAKILDQIHTEQSYIGQTNVFQTEDVPATLNIGVLRGE